MFRLYFNLNVGDGPDKVKLGDGKLLELLLKWGPVIAAIFGLKLPALPISDPVAPDATI